MPTPPRTAAHSRSTAVVHVLTRLRVVARALPLADVLEHRAAGHVPVVHRGDPFRVEHVAPAAPGQRGERDRRVRRPERRDAEILHGDAEQLGGDSGGDDPGGLALIVCGADGGVALDVFHRAHAGTDRADEIGHRRVALDVDELARGRVRIGHPPQHQAGPRRDHRIGLAGNRVRSSGEPEPGQRPRGRLTSAPQASRQVEHSVGRTHDAHPVEMPHRVRRRRGRRRSAACRVPG